LSVGRLLSLFLFPQVAYLFSHMSTPWPRAFLTFGHGWMIVIIEPCIISTKTMIVYTFLTYGFLVCFCCIKKEIIIIIKIMIIIHIKIFECLFLFSTKFLSLLPRLKFYLDTFRPDFSDFRSETLITIVKVPFLNRLFLNTCLPFRIKLS